MGEIKLNKKQREGLELAIEAYREGDSYICISGFAGTGKTELVRFITRELAIPDAEIAYIAYTGKAARVLQERGCPNAKTAHRLLYKSFPRSDGTFYHLPVKYIREKIIIVDEVSMLPAKMWELLLSYGRFVIALGDPAQLPSIYEDNGVLTYPDVFLDEIMRQDSDSEIIPLTMDIRNGKTITPFQGHEVQIRPKEDLTLGMLKWADIIIVATNEKRNYYNKIMRQSIWGEEVSKIPKEGEKVICLKNSWDIANAYHDCLVNGLIGTIWNIRKIKDPYAGELYLVDFLPEEYEREDLNGWFKNILLDKGLIEDGKSNLEYKQIKKTVKKLQQFVYGYAVTCWKAQGSQWNKVLVIEENFPYDKDTHQRFMYTAATRAIDKLVIIKN